MLIPGALLVSLDSREKLRFRANKIVLGLLVVIMGKEEKGPAGSGHQLEVNPKELKIPLVH